MTGGGAGSPGVVQRKETAVRYTDKKVGVAEEMGLQTLVMVRREESEQLLWDTEGQDLLYGEAERNGNKRQHFDNILIGSHG